MQTQKDHLHAYQTLVGRMSSALLRGDTNHGVPPAQGCKLGLVLGMVLALLAGAGFWVYGLIKPGGSTSWRASGAVVVEKESGNRYIYLGSQLRPVPNQASVLLLQGSPGKVVVVSRASLAGVAHGAPIGIAGAPDTVPAASALARGPWLLCLTGVPAATVVDVPAVGDAAALPDKTYLWVADERGGQYLIWQNRKLPIGDRSAPPALGLTTGLPPVAPDAWLAALPEGRTVGALAIPNAGQPGPDVAGGHHKAGDLLVQDNTNGIKRYYVVMADGVAPVSPTDFALLQAKAGRPATPVDAGGIVAAPHSAELSLSDSTPDLVSAKPAPANDGAACVRQRPQGTDLVGDVVTVPRGKLRPDRQVALRPDTGMLVASVPAPVERGRKPDRYLITDQGRKFLLRDDDTITALGYGGVVPVPMPAEVLVTIRSGPALSRNAIGVTEG